MSGELRCMAVQGTVGLGALYCGYRTTTVDANGRPCCKRHMGKQVGIEWFGDRRNYPHGTGQERHRPWKFKHGEFRRPSPTPTRPKETP